MFPWMTHGTYSGGIQGQGAAYLDVTNNTGNFIDGIPTCMEGASDLKFGSSFQYHDHGTMCGTHSYYDVYGFGRVDLWENNVVCGGDSGSYIRRNNGPGGSSTAVGLTSFRASAVSENGQCSRTTSTDTATVGFSRMWRINEWAQEAFGVSMKAWGTP